jgi:protein-S-isoprenylcysteine O-methyltransferase Ste14
LTEAVSESLFRVFFACVFSCLTAVRLTFRIRSGLLREPLYSPAEPAGFILFRSILGVPLLLSVFQYCFLPDRCSWSYLVLPRPLRIAGTVSAVLSLLLLAWAHRTLGSLFTTGPAPKDDHTLVMKGPYALIRHPMYLAYFVLFLSAFFISENWVIGSTGLAIITMLMTVRRIREERLLFERFGEAYRHYRERTGGFIPRRGSVRPRTPKTEKR